MSSAVRLSSVCLSSVVCNVRAPYSGDWNFRQYFYTMWYLGYPWPLYKNLTEIVQGNPSVWGVKHKRGADFGPIQNAISRKRCKIGAMLLLITNRKSHMSFRLVPNSVTLDDLERRNSRYRRVISSNSVAFGSDYVKVVEDMPVRTAAEM